jgi:hypothetical protein
MYVETFMPTSKSEISLCGVTYLPVSRPTYTNQHIRNHNHNHNSTFLTISHIHIFLTHGQCGGGAVYNICLLFVMVIVLYDHCDYSGGRLISPTHTHTVIPKCPIPEPTPPATKK